MTLNFKEVKCKAFAMKANVLWKILNVALLMLHSARHLELIHKQNHCSGLCSCCFYFCSFALDSQFWAFSLHCQQKCLRMALWLNIVWSNGKLLTELSLAYLSSLNLAKESNSFFEGSSYFFHNICDKQYMAYIMYHISCIITWYITYNII